jgi:hypothetical protein
MPHTIYYALYALCGYADGAQFFRGESGKMTKRERRERRAGRRQSDRGSYGFQQWPCQAQARHCTAHKIPCRGHQKHPLLYIVHPFFGKQQRKEERPEKREEGEGREKEKEKEKEKGGPKGRMRGLVRSKSEKGVREGGGPEGEKGEGEGPETWEAEGRMRDAGHTHARCTGGGWEGQGAQEK